MTVKSSISLSDEQDAFARRLVRQGKYSSVSAVLQQALEILKTRTEDEELERDALRVLLKKRAEGPFISMDEFNERVDAMLARKRQEHDL